MPERKVTWASGMKTASLGRSCRRQRTLSVSTSPTFPGLVKAGAPCSPGSARPLPLASSATTHQRMGTEYTWAEAPADATAKARRRVIGVRAFIGDSYSHGKGGYHLRMREPTHRGGRSYRPSKTSPRLPPTVRCSCRAAACAACARTGASLSYKAIAASAIRRPCQRPASESKG